MTDTGPTLPHRFHGVPLQSLRVEIVDGPDAGLSRTVGNDVVTVGTASDNDLVLTDPTVSRYHMEISISEDRIAVVDHHSTNGVEVSGAYIQKGTVAKGALLQLGRTKIRVGRGDPVTVDLFEGDTLSDLRGRSPEMRRMMAKIAKVAESDAPVLLQGETGTGKEIIARAVHETSGRRDNPFELVDCGTLMPTLIASELFGHERGAFTGADKQYVGAFERAHGGSLFLDEIGDLPLNLQTALLGALERRKFRRVGGTEPIEVNVRVISATHRDLRVAVNEERFRQDLYYRLAVVRIDIPPLRRRLADIPLLLEHFLRESGYSGAVEELIPSTVLKDLENHSWPGNVRELRNFVEAALATGAPPEMEVDSASAPSAPPSGWDEHVDKLARTQTYREASRAFDRAYFTKLLGVTNGNVTEASRSADMNRTYLTRLLKRLALR